jgi:hypothetical protein
MTELEFEEFMQTTECEYAYAEYIEEHSNIGNGTMLINAMERGDHWEDFVDSMVTK